MKKFAAVGQGFSGATDSLAEAQAWARNNRSGAVYQRLDACGEDHEVGSEPNDCYACLAEQTAAFARGYLALWREMGIQDADDWLCELRERADCLSLPAGANKSSRLVNMPTNSPSERQQPTCEKCGRRTVDGKCACAYLPAERQQQAARLADYVCQRVAELPNRTSPDEWPEAMLVTEAELRQIVSDAGAAALLREEALAEQIDQVIATTLPKTPRAARLRDRVRALFQPQETP